MKLKWRPVLLTATLLTLALTGCSSDSTTTSQETESASDTFRKYSGNHHDVEFRAALRNSWVGTSETSETEVMAQNDQQDITSSGRGFLADGLLDVGKQMGESLVKKGLSYAIDSAFGIQSKSQEEADETNFINETLLGIQHQLTAIQNNLTDVYNNQTEQMSKQDINQLQTITDFSNAEALIIAASSNETNFTNLYTNFISDLENSTSAPDYDVDFKDLCGQSNAFISTYYNGLDTSQDTTTILAYAYDVLNDLFGQSALAKTQVSTFKTDATQYINDLLGTKSSTGTQLTNAATGINLVSNYYAAGTRVTQATYGIANLLQKAYTVMAFTLQLAAQSNCTYNKTTMLDYISTPNLYAAGIIYDGIDFSTLTPTTLSTALKTLGTNFNKLFVTPALADIDKIAKPFVTYGGTDDNYWDPAAAVTFAGLNLESDFMQSGCFPLSYVKNVNVNGNLDYLAAECNYNGNWTVLQLYIPTNNGTEGLINIRYLTDPQDYGLIGDPDSDSLRKFMTQPGTIASAGTCSSHYKHVCTCGFDDCWVSQASIALNGSAPLYGAAYFSNMDGASFQNETGINQRYGYDLSTTCNGGYPDDSCSGLFGALAITPNGHVFWGCIESTYCCNETVNYMLNTQVNFGLASITEETGGNYGNLSYSDGTGVDANGPSQNAAGENGNTDNSLAEYGFGMALQSAPQPDAEPGSVCANQATIVLSPVYSYSDDGRQSGTVTDANTISLSDGTTGTFDDAYSTLTLGGTTWNRVTSNSENVGPDAMQGLWQSGTGSKAVYMSTRCD